MKEHSAAWPQTTARAEDIPKAGDVHLTPRQLDVLALLCEGLSNKVISRRLDISTGTVKTHVSTILRELRVTNRLQAFVLAQRYGLVARAALSDAGIGQRMRVGRRARFLERTARARDRAPAQSARLSGLA